MAETELSTESGHKFFMRNFYMHMQPVTCAAVKKLIRLAKLQKNEICWNLNSFEEYVKCREIEVHFFG